MSRRGRCRRAAGGGTFAPSGLAGLVLHLDATKGITLNGSDVSAWADQSTSGWDATQGTAADQPAYNATGLNGRPTVTFDGVTEWMDFGAISHAASDWTVLAVYDQVLDDGTNQYLVDSQLGRLIITPGRGAGKIIAYHDGAWYGTQVYSTGVGQRTWVLEAAASGRIRRDGADVEAGLGYTQVGIGTSTALGARYGGGGAPQWGGSLSELLIYNRALSDAEIANVEGYLRAKWGTP